VHMPASAEASLPWFHRQKRKAMDDLQGKVHNWPETIAEQVSH